MTDPLDTLEQDDDPVEEESTTEPPKPEDEPAEEARLAFVPGGVRIRF